MKKSVKPSTYKGQIRANTSKSSMQRAIAIAGLARGTSTILSPNYANDSLKAMEIMKKMGAEMVQGENALYITGGKIVYPSHFNCGESGLSARMFSPLAATFNVPIIVNGEGSLMNRPQHVIEDTLKQCGVKVKSSNGYLPVVVEGPLKPGRIELDGSFTSQVLTGLLIALPFISGDTTLVVSNLKSKAYIDLTIDILRAFGVEISRDGYETFFIRGKQRPVTGKYEVEPDWSGVAFHLVGAAIAGEAEVVMRKTESLQPDRAILDVLRQAGASVEVLEDRVRVYRKNLSAFMYDATDSPDLFPPLAVLAMNAKGTSRIHGVERLVHKESNRAEGLMKEMGKLGADITVEGNTMVIKGSALKGGTMHSNNDHRIAMAAAIAGLNARGQVVIENAESINKSYPEFFDDFAALTNH